MAQNDVKFSKRQLEAIEWDSNRELIVSAAAGSGKTTVLIKRIIDRITEKRIPIDEFLVVTFTHASASELKEKISSALNKKIKEDPNDEWLRIQLSNVGRASIGTMHSFCLKIIKEYHEHPAISLPKSVHILSDEKSKQMLFDAIDEVLTDEYAKADNTEFIAMLDTFASFKNDGKVRALIKSLHNFALNNEDPYKWLADQSLTEQNGKYISHYTDFVLKAANEAKAILDECKKDFKSDSVLDETVDGLIAAFRKYIDFMHQGDIASANEALQGEITAINLNRGPRKGDAAIAQKAVLKCIKNKYTDMLIVNSDNAPEGLSVKGAINELLRVTCFVAKRFSEKKLKARSVDYSDMEHMTLRLFDDESVCNIYRSKFKHILFDEYQDCNRIQELIVKKIADNAVYFMVGDVKQSIYGFRQADPSLFLNKYLNYKYDKAAEYAVIELNENYRSRKNVLNAANKVFFNIMTEAFCGMDYNSENALNAKATYPEHEAAEQTFASEPVRLVGIKTKDRGSEDPRKAQILYIIKAIREYKNKKLVWDAKKGEYRKLRFSDIAILMRSPKSATELIKRFFAATEIPVNVMQDGDISHMPEINLLVCILRCINNPYNDIALMATLHSYIFDISDNELLEIMQYGNDNSLELITKIDNYIADADNFSEAFWEKNGISAEIVKKLKVFKKRYSEWLDNERYMSGTEFIDHIIESTGYIEFFGAFENGVQRKNNIMRFYDVLSQQMAVTSGGLYECVKILDNIDENGIVGENGASLADAVSVMSIHKSKGLEFPVVFIMDMDKAFSADELKQTVLMHKDHGVVSKLIDCNDRVEYSTYAYEALKNLISLEQKREEQRILYVAMTRAREQLIMLGKVGDTTLDYLYNGHLFCDIARQNDMLGWVLYALLADNSTNTLASSAKDLRQVPFEVGIKKTDYTSNWIFEICDIVYDDEGRFSAVSINSESIDIKSVSAKDEYAKSEEDSEILSSSKSYNADELIQKLSYKYPHEAATRLNSKLSVSQIKRISGEKKKKDEYSVPDEGADRVKIISTDSSISPTKLGTLYHFFMQHITVKAPYTAADFEADISRMKEKRLICEKDAARLKYGKFKAFFESDVGRRMAEADWLKREKNFSYFVEAGTVLPDINTDEKILIQGVVDCFFKDKNGKLVLVDYKTDKASEENELELAERYKMQLLLYRSALSDILNIAVDECYIYSFALERFINVDF